MIKRNKDGGTAGRRSRCGGTLGIITEGRTIWHNTAVHHHHRLPALTCLSLPGPLATPRLPLSPSCPCTQYPPESRHRGIVGCGYSSSSSSPIGEKLLSHEVSCYPPRHAPLHASPPRLDSVMFRDYMSGIDTGTDYGITGRPNSTARPRCSAPLLFPRSGFYVL